MVPFAIDVKGGGRLRGSIGLLVDVLPSMPKGETIGNVVIDGKGGTPSNRAKRAA